MGPQSRQGRYLSQHHPNQKRWHHNLQTQRKGRARRWLLVGQRLQRQGYFVPNKLNGYTLNNVTANKGDDGSVTIQFGGCDGQIPNCIPITRGWNYMVRLYRPRPEILNGSW